MASSRFGDFHQVRTGTFHPRFGNARHDALDHARIVLLPGRPLTIFHGRMHELDADIRVYGSNRQRYHFAARVRFGHDHIRMVPMIGSDRRLLPIAAGNLAGNRPPGYSHAHYQRRRDNYRPHRRYWFPMDRRR